MAQLGHRMEAGPDEGERYMTTGDAREMLDRLLVLGDDGTALIQAKTSVGGKVLRMWATAVPSRPLTEKEDWDTLAARYAPEAIPAPPPLEIEPRAVTRPAALVRPAAKHAK